MREPLLALIGFLLSTVCAQYDEVQLGSSNRRNFDDDVLETYDYTYDTGKTEDLVTIVEDPLDQDPNRRRIVPNRKPAFSPNSLFRNPPNSNTRTSSLSGPESCKSRSRTVSHETACDLYYECYEGQGFLQACPNGLVYKNTGRNGLIGVCDYPHNVNCVNREERNPPQSTEHCDWLYGIFGHETSCTRYWTCWNGTATEQFCIGGLLYNEETHACDWPQNVAGCQKHPLCKDDANGNVPLGKSCNRYWACQGGYPRLQRCPAMLVFDKNRKRCVSPPTEDCDIPTTRTPPTDQQNNNNDGQQQRSANPRRGGGQRRPRPQIQERQEDRQQDRRNEPKQQAPLSGPLPFNIPGGAIPFNSK